MSRHATESVCPRVEVLETREVPATFTVDSTVSIAGKMTLSEAITAANNAVGADEIKFNIPLADAGYDAVRGVFVIDSKAGAQLPTILDKVTIDGYTQPVGREGIKVEIRGENKAGVFGLAIGADGCVLRGLAVYGAETGIGILLAAANNSIQDCIIGTRASGNEAGFGNEVGIDIAGDSNWVVACTVSGNKDAGIKITASKNTVQECVIGLTSSGTTALPNGTDPQFDEPRAGILITVGLAQDAKNNLITGNTISGNAATGVALAGGIIGEVSFNTIANNYIGLSADGKTVVANKTDGVLIRSTATDNVIGHSKLAGGTYVSGRNVIVGNADPVGERSAIRLESPESVRNTIQGNFVGILADGVTRAGGFGSLVIVFGNENTIGGVNNATKEGGGPISLGNVISGGSGLLVYGSSNTIRGNLVGTDKDGTVAVGGSGIRINGNNNIIGGNLETERNVASGNDGAGIRIRGTGNAVYGNIVGLNALGTGKLGNRGNGIEVNTASGTIIGKADDGMTKYRNIISGNGNDKLGITPSENNGVYVTNSGTTTIANNYIGLKLDGTAGVDIGNLRGGVFIDLVCSDTKIGLAGVGNYISSNGNYGVNIRSAGGTGGTSLTDNRIGVLLDETKAARNGGAANDKLPEAQALFGIWIDSDQIDRIVMGEVTTYVGVTHSGTAGQYKVAYDSTG